MKGFDESRVLIVSGAHFRVATNFHILSLTELSLLLFVVFFVFPFVFFVITIYAGDSALQTETN